MNRNAWLGLAACAIGALAVFGLWRAWSESERQARQAQRERQDVEDRAEQQTYAERLMAESAPLIPEVLEGVALGKTLSQIQAARGVGVSPVASERGNPLLIYQEHLQNGGQAIYGFDRGSQHLVQVQLLSLLPTLDAISPHLAAMNERYGRPTGIWDCPSTGDVPTRRFTWRLSRITISDVFLIYGDRVSLTFYIGTTEMIGSSLMMGGCHAVSGDQIGDFPVASPEQIERANRGRPPT